MNTLANTLPSSAVAKAEQDLMDKFKSAALSITTLYRSSQGAAKRHFDAGYLAALDDLLAVIQHGVSADLTPGPSKNSGEVDAADEGMSIGRVMDWIEARQEAIRIKAREDEEDEEERESRRRAGPTGTGARDVRDKTKVKTPLPTTSTSTHAAAHSPGGVTSGTSSSCSIYISTHTSSAVRPQTRARLRSQAKEAPVTFPPRIDSEFMSTTPGPLSGPPLSVTSVLGAKRRHAAMLLDSYAPTSASLPANVSFPSFDFNSGGGSPSSASSGAVSEGFAFSGGAGTGTATRRRVRNTRGGALSASRADNVHASINGGLGGDSMMDVEEEGGRERKRVTRR
ncbi:hypothetical protein DFH11DRAFT_1732096 [Phellopilus nigrolimitatus]|nr:hypothetical protein DFH11DRAFT_1732096 [Phellopilus nigrolimitatus]